MEIQEEKTAQINNLSPEVSSVSSRKFFLPLIIGAVVLGILSGYLLSRRGKSEGELPGGSGIISEEQIKTGQEYGAKNQSFKDTTIGVIEKGGIDGEGTHKLIREGGPSQTVYMTSSVLDLDQFTGKKVQVWGETFQGQKAGWLMDVGRLKILE
ncbi:MAG: hypothetical protein BWY24_00905 [Microgenomates group bacterium ADurb.Bin219]|nr:MAG: hypothetical protein BWY24_00905 [Microgenomates group bacterium ADurb.Bin219]HNP89297.1 hypothetical protein [Candidatus Woesebacteria bacterium]